MADVHNDLTAQASLSSFDFDFNLDHRIPRSPLSVAFDAQSIRTYSTDFECGDLGFLTSQTLQQEHDHDGPNAQTSYDPILPRQSNADLCDSNLVGWETGCDPGNPLYWPLPRKLGMCLVVSLLTFTVSLASSIFSEDVHVTATMFGVGERVTVLGVSLYVLGFACGESHKWSLTSVWRRLTNAGPLVFGPASELYGRSRPLLFGFACFAIFQIPLAVARDVQTILICRFLAAAFGSAPLAIAPGILVDLWLSHARNLATLCWLIAIFAGTTAGPLIGAFTLANPEMGWRWTAWYVVDHLYQI